MACLLGIEDEAIGPAESTDFTVNKVGGKPNWASGIHHQNPECRLCGKKMLLAVQIYAPLDDSPNHRTLYLFCCLNSGCHMKSEGWACLRDEVKDTSSPSAAAQVPAAVTAPTNPTAWVEDADDWDDGDEAVAQAETCMENLSIATASKQQVDETKIAVDQEQTINPNSDRILTDIEPSAEVEGLMEESVTLDDAPVKPTVDIRALLAPSSAALLPEPTAAEFSSFYLSVAEEQLQFATQSSKLDSRAKELLAEYQRREKCDWKKMESSATSKSADGEAYEKARPSHGDELVHKFITRVKQSCPEQLIRYQLGAHPLLLKPLKDGGRMPPCRNCGAHLVFEMQLMPHLSQRLTLIQFPDNPNPIEVGTVIAFTCSNSCWDEAGGIVPRQEHLVVQSDLIC